MFDFAWSELALIGVVALILIGPKDLPVAIKAVTDMIKKARAMAAEFRGHVDEMVREANLEEIRGSLNEIRNFDLNSLVEKTVDPDGTIRNAFTGEAMPGAAPAAETEAAPAAPAVPPPFGPAQETEGAPPAFIPPGFVAPAPAPAFIPPGATRPRPRA
jgi:sec-independent protein translocase protein TatB